ncbi:MAG: DUF2726 domain-containing protein [Cupriavidus sp.]|nr:MAG: DUF2726 domain-containing protein [Cupriavidus sp.]
MQGTPHAKNIAEGFSVSRKGKYSKNGKVVVYTPAEIAPAPLSGHETATTAYLTFAELRSEAANYLEKQYWGKLQELSATPLESFSPTERDEAKVQLLRARVWALAKGQMDSLYGVADEDKNALKAALQELHSLVEVFDGYPEFALFALSFGYSAVDVLSGYLALSHKIPSAPSFLYVSHLRKFGLRLMNADIWDDDEDAYLELRARTPKTADIVATLKDAYARAREANAIDLDEWLKLKFFDLELGWRTIDPWDTDSVSKELQEFDATPLSLLTEVTVHGPYLPLTPKAWGFLWELHHAGERGLQDLLKRYSAPLGSDLCEGLKHIIKSYFSEGSAIDEQLAEAVRCFCRFHASGGLDYSHYLVVDHPLYRGALELDFHNLECPSPIELILHIAEIAPKGYPRTGELFTLYSTIDAARAYGAVEAGLLQSKHFQWLCQCPEFQWMAAATMATPCEFAMVTVGALMKSAKSGLRLGGYLSHRPTGKMSHNETMQVLSLLDEFSPMRAAVDADTYRNWPFAVGAIFDSLNYEHRTAVELALEVGRTLASDLTSSGSLFTLGYLEQMAGDQAEALSAYLESLRSSKSVSEALKKNVQILLANISDLETAEQILYRLQQFSEFGCHTATINDFLRDAERRLKTHKNQDQFEKTAVTRWPSLTAQARKLLSALHQIDGYQGFEELGRYAGMDAVWAERHYNKLLELGMILESKGKWEVNPHIVDLLERESQHSVVGRIIRSQGTTAVKQVFNSQREFSIYQMLVQLCPNHLVFPNCSLQSIMSYDKLKELVEDEDFGYYLRASVDIVVVSTTTYLPMLAIEVDSTWHDTERQIAKDERKDRLFATAGIPFMRLRPLGSPSQDVIRGQVAEHLHELIGTLRSDIPGYEQARKLLDELSGVAE